MEFDPDRRRMSVIVQAPSGNKSKLLWISTYLMLYLIQFFKCSFFFLGEKLLFVKGAESSVLPACIGGEIEKTRIHVDEFALVSANFSYFKNH